jgi:non-canonical (house-cleaning) NTP pyrophosphatase
MIDVGDKHVLHVQSSFSRGLIVEEVLVVQEGLDLFLGDFGFWDVCLVADQNEESVGVGVAFDFVDPVVLDVLEGVALGQVEDEEDRVGI